MLTAIIFTILTALIPVRKKQEQEQEQESAEAEPEPDSPVKLNRLVERLYRTDYGTAAYAALEKEVHRLAEIYYG